MTDLVRCSCGFAAKTEAALERIRKGREPDQHKLYYAFADGVLALENSDHRITDVAICHLLTAVSELADKVKPPKQKEREWELRDIVGRKDGSLDPKIVKWLSPHEHDVFGFGAHISHSKSEYRNLTIEAERAGEKGVARQRQEARYQ